MNSDFLMCISHDCHLRERCLRNSASGTKPNPAHQSYALFQPDDCEYFLEKFDDLIEPSVSVWKTSLHQGKYKHVKTSSEEFANNKEV